LHDIQETLSYRPKVVIVSGYLDGSSGETSKSYTQDVLEKPASFKAALEIDFQSKVEKLIEQTLFVIEAGAISQYIVTKSVEEEVDIFILKPFNSLRFKEVLQC
jgi:hypothetical protein